MSNFHEIVAHSFTNREISKFRRDVVSWYADEHWAASDCNWEFARIWLTGALDAVEARCEEFVNGIT